MVIGLAAQLTIANFEAGDALVINGLAGNDTIDASSLKAGQVKLTLNGGDGDDLIVGSQGDDLVNGGRGNDTALLGAGNDTFVWNPGDGSDTVEGQAGTDTMLFNGANINENIDISANGGRVRFTRDVGNVTMDLNDVENIQFNALGGADTITVNDLTGTDVTQVNLDLGVNGAGDGSADTVIINATNGDDVDLRLQHQRRGHGDGPLRDGDDLELRRQRSHRDQRPRRRRRHRGDGACGGHRSPPMAATAMTSLSAVTSSTS